MEPRITGQHLPARARGRIALEDAVDVFAQVREHGGPIGRGAAGCKGATRRFAAHAWTRAFGARPRLRLARSARDSITAARTPRSRSISVCVGRARLNSRRTRTIIGFGSAGAGEPGRGGARSEGAGGFSR